LHHSAFVVSVANSTLVNYSTRKGLQVASISSSSTEGLVAISNGQEFGNSGDGKAVSWWEETSSFRITSVLSACVVIKACDIFVDTTNSRIARVNGTVSVIVTDSSHVDIGLEASIYRMAILNLAFVSIVAGLLGVDTSVCVRIASVNSANVSVIALLGSGHTFSVSRITLVDHAWNRWANNGNWIHAEVAWLCRISASSVRIANISCAGIVVVTINGSEGASYLRVTSWSSAFVGGSACNVGIDATSCWIAHVGSASITIVASDWAINTSVSTDVGSATLGSASVTILTR